MRPLGTSRLCTLIHEIDEEDLAGFGMVAFWAVILIVLLMTVLIDPPSAITDADLVRLSYSELLPSWPSLHVDDFRY
jgi:hypothetical protein